MSIMAVGKSPAGVRELGEIQPAFRTVEARRGDTTARCPVCKGSNSLPAGDAPRFIICRGCSTSFYVAFK